MFEDWTQRNRLVEEYEKLSKSLSQFPMGKDWRDPKEIENYQPGDQEKLLIEKLWDIDEKIRFHDQEALLRKARELHISYPPFHDRNIWEFRKNQYSTPLMTANGISYFNNEIRKEKNDRWDRIFKIIMTIIGTVIAAAVLAK